MADKNGEKPAAEMKRYVGQAVYIFAFDVAYDMKRQAVSHVLGEPTESFRVDTSARGPRQPFFYHPQIVHLSPVECTGPAGPLKLSRSVKLFSVAAISVVLRADFAVDRLEDLTPFHDLRIEGRTLSAEALALAEQVLADLRPYYVRPLERLVEDEPYTVFCVGSPQSGLKGEPFDAEAWLQANRRPVASLLTEERDVAALSAQEAGDSTSVYLSYYQHDLAVVDWDGALIMDQPRLFAEVLHVIELANVQLIEMAAYDRLLDASLEKAYRDLAGRKVRGLRQTVRDLGEMRVDMARLNDELSNTAKFLGDWHLARLYQSVSNRFHLGDWQRVIADKLRTLDSLYQILKQDQTNRWMMILEATIVLLFILDLVILFFGKG